MTQRVRAPTKSSPWTRLDADRRNAILLYAGIGSLIIFALAIIAIGYYDSRVKPASGTVLTVGSRKFDVSYLQRRMKSQIQSGQISNSGTFADLATSTLSTIEQEELTRQSAAALGIEVTDSDIDDNIKNAAGLLTGAPQDVFASAYRALLLRTGLPNSEYREIVKAQVIQQKYSLQTRATLPDQAPQVKLHLIKVGTQSKALDLSQKLKQGEGFDNLAVANSTDPTKSNGGDAGWVARGTLPQAVEDAAFSLPFDLPSDVLEVAEGFYLIKVDDRADARDVDVTQKALIAQKSFSSTVDATKTKLGVKPSLTAEQITYIARRISGTIPSQPPRPQPLAPQPALPPPGDRPAQSGPPGG